MAPPLYPTTILNVSDMPPSNILEQNSQLILVFDVLPLQSITFGLIHTAIAEDFSIKCWLSNQLGAGPYILFPAPFAYFSLLRIPAPTIVYDMALSEPKTTSTSIAIGPEYAVAPGTYYLNFLNLISTKNVFSYTMSIS